MNPRLIALDGPLKESLFMIDVPEFSIGRKSGSALIIEDYSISRQHCVITNQESGFVISDIGSQNGTFVNGIPILERPIQHGDRIQVGSSLFLFLTEEKDDAETQDVHEATVEFEDSNPPVTSTIALQPTANLAFGMRSADATASSKRAEQELRIVIDLTNSLNSTAGVEKLCRRLLDSIFDIVTADRGAILVKRADSGETPAILAARGGLGPLGSFPISRTVFEKAFSDKVGLLCQDVQKHEEFAAAQSLIASSTSSLVAAPMTVLGKSVGLIYVDTQKSGRQLDEHDLRLVAVVASMAALALDNAQRVEWLEGENRRLQSEINVQHDMIGESPAMHTVYQFIEKVASRDSTALITGESGTGKELVARAIHRNSRRAGKPFVAINCAALTETLLESELFGHEKGAFTGALNQKRGKLEAAQGGTVFLDEIGEMAHSLQAKILRVLQQREFERVGGTQSIHVDIRFIAATNRDLKEAIRDGAFRQDLYYRLDVVSLRMPPLRERREDIPLLASYFAVRFSEATNRSIVGFSAEARALLNSYNWEGNVRELENAIERAVVMGSTELILPEDLPESILETQHHTPPNPGYHSAIKEAKKQVILRAIDEADGNLTEAAKRLSINPTYLHRLIRNLNLRPNVQRSAGPS